MLPLGVTSGFRRNVSDVPRFYAKADGHWHTEWTGTGCSTTA